MDWFLYDKNFYSYDLKGIETTRVAQKYNHLKFNVKMSPLKLIVKTLNSFLEKILKTYPRQRTNF